MHHTTLVSRGAAPRRLALGSWLEPAPLEVCVTRMLWHWPHAHKTGGTDDEADNAAAGVARCSSERVSGGPTVSIDAPHLCGPYPSTLVWMLWHRQLRALFDGLQAWQLRL